MKKLFVSLCLLMLVIAVQAQYSQWTYGSSASGATGGALNGAVLRYGPDPGHIMAGTIMAGNGRYVYVVKNDLSGNSTVAPYFNKRYEIRNGGGALLPVQSAKVVELKNGSGYAIGGIAKEGTNWMIFYMKLDAMGGVLVPPVVYSLPFVPISMELGNIRENNAGDELYICGGVNFTTPSYRWGNYFIHKIYQSGSIDWSNTYPIFHTYTPRVFAADIIENATSTELAVTGILSLSPPSTTQSDGFFTKIDPVTGIPFAYLAQAYGLYSTDDEIFSIAYSNSDPLGNPRYLVAGRTKALVSGNWDTWIMLLDQNGTVIWTTTSDINGSNLDDGMGGIVERLNPTTGAYEYYAAGVGVVGVSGDFYLLKGLVNSGGTITGAYTYGDPSGGDFGFGLDYTDNSPGTGVAMFGMSNSFTGLGTGYKIHFVKAYFNGVSCQYEEQNAYNNLGIPWRENYDMTMNEHFNHSDREYDIVDYEEANICLEEEVPGGSNDLVMRPGNTGDATRSTINETGITLAPNPAAQGTGMLQMDVEKATAGATVQVVIADMLGRQYVNQQFVIQQDGIQHLDIDISNAGLAAGVYLLKVSGIEKPVSTVLIVK